MSTIYRGVGSSSRQATISVRVKLEGGLDRSRSHDWRTARCSEMPRSCALCVAPDAVFASSLSRRNIEVVRGEKKGGGSCGGGVC